jgi:hypothetical protein
MFPRTTRPPALATDTLASSSLSAGHVPAPSRVVDVTHARVADREALLRGPGGLSTRSVIADPCQGELSATRIVRPAPHGARETVAKVGHGAPSRLVHAHDARCVCPLSGHFAETERALMDDITSQAARLATTLRWLLALVALMGLVVLMRWSR